MKKNINIMENKYKYLDKKGNVLPGYEYKREEKKDKPMNQDRITGETDDERYQRLDKEYRKTLK